MKTISVAHSPDADDIFMYWAVKLGWVSSEYSFVNTALDIETLNEEALKGSFDISAISFALYPKIKNEYALLRTAVSFGEGYGPKLIKKKSTKLKRNFKVALSGKYTTNAMIFRIAYPEARIIYKNFLDIEKAVLADEVDAGVLIHESILDFDKTLCVEREIFEIWQNLNKEDLPLPLGGMAIRRSIPLLRAIECERVLTQAVQTAQERKEELSKILLEKGLIRVNAEKLNTYLNMYANEASVSLNDLQKKALNMLFNIGYKYKFYESDLDVEDYLIPTEYKKIRFS